MYNGSNCNREPKLPDILTEPLNPRALWIGDDPLFMKDHLKLPIKSLVND